MSDYAQIEDFSAKDSLSAGDPEKTILGADIDAELTAIATAISTKYDSSDLASQVQAETGSSNSVLMTPLRAQQWGEANAGIVADLRTLSDPAADRLLFWDDSAGAAAFLSLSSNLSLSGTTLDVGSNVALLNASNTFTSPIISKGASSVPLVLGYTGAAAGENEYGFNIGVSGSLSIHTRDAAAAFGEAFISVGRTGTNVDSMALAADSITLNGVSSSDFARLSQNNIFTGSAQYISHSVNPSLYLHDTDAAADEKYWRFTNIGGTFAIYASTDAQVATEAAIQITRIGTDVNGLTLSANVITLNGVNSTDFSRNSQANTFTGIQTFTASDFASVLVQSSAPGVRWLESDAAADNRIWELGAAGESFIGRIRSDDFSSIANWLTVARTGTTVDSINLAATSITANGSEILTTADEGTGNGLDADTLDGLEGASYRSASNMNAGTLSDARLSSNVPLKNAVNTFTQAYTSGAPTGSAAIVLSSAVPMLVFNETDAAANNKIWDIVASGETLLFQMSTDAGSFASWLQVTRTGTVADIVSFSSGTVEFTNRPQMATAGGLLAHASGSNTGGSVTLSTSAASGTPAAGDVWIQHEA